ncbi:hypothetical protein JMJ77_0002909, partial [Colletotrichum scovillei]
GNDRNTESPNGTSTTSLDPPFLCLRSTLLGRWPWQDTKVIGAIFIHFTHCRPRSRHHQVSTGYPHPQTPSQIDFVFTS